MRDAAALRSWAGSRSSLAMALRWCLFEELFSESREDSLGNRLLWILLGYLLFIAVAVHLFVAGRRTISIAKGNSPPSPRFGWGSVLLGSLLLFAAANNRFHVLPKRQALSQLEYQNQTQTAAGNVVTLAICVGSFFSDSFGNLERLAPATQPALTLVLAASKM